jgi:hypothetical protein
MQVSQLSSTTQRGTEIEKGLSSTSQISSLYSRQAKLREAESGSRVKWRQAREKQCEYQTLRAGFSIRITIAETWMTAVYKPAEDNQAVDSAQLQ